MPLPLDPSTLARLGRGEVLVSTEPKAGSKNPTLVVQAVIEAAPADVWAVIEDSSQYARFMPRVKRAEELLRDGNRIHTRVTVDMPFPLRNLTATTEVFHTEEPPSRFVREWKQLSGDYRSNEGSWTLTTHEEDPARTYVLYAAHIEPKIPIPKKIQSAVQERAMPKMIDVIRAETARRRG
jgi:uncharacterized protein YndB with AHSA1/START domain